MNQGEIDARRAANSMSLGGDAARRALDAAAGLLSFDELAYTPPRLHVLWLENSLDCRTWCALRPPPAAAAAVRMRAAAHVRRGARSQVVLLRHSGGDGSATQALHAARRADLRRTEPRFQSSGTHAAAVAAAG